MCEHFSEIPLLLQSTHAAIQLNLVITLDPSSYFVSKIFITDESPPGLIEEVITNKAPVAEVGKIEGKACIILKKLIFHKIPLDS